MLNHYNFSLWN